MNILKNKIIMIVLLTFLLSFTISAIDSKSKYGVGFQSSFPAWGISGSIDLTPPKLCLQGIIGFASYLKTIAGKIVYKFKQKNKFNTYGYGMIGLWSYDGENTIGFGGGVGIEWDWRALSNELPELWWNMEIGLASVNLTYYNYSTLSIGLGVHYRF